MNKILSSLLVATACTLAAAPGYAVTYTLTDLGPSFSNAQSSLRYGLPYFLTANGDVYYQTGSQSYRYSNGVSSVLAGSGTGILRGANARGDYIIGTKLYQSPGAVYAFGGNNPTTAINDNHDAAISIGGVSTYASIAGYSPSDTTFASFPGRADAQVQAISGNGYGAGVTLTGGGSITGVYTSQFAPSDLSERAGTPGNQGPHDGRDHDATNLVQYAAGPNAYFDSVVGVSNAGMIAGTMETPGSTNFRDSMAYVGVNGAVTVIGALGPSNADLRGRSFAYDINQSGQVVGSSTIGGVRFFNNQIAFDFQHGFLYEGGKLSDLNTLLDRTSASRYTITSGLSINDSGSILVAFGDGNLGTNNAIEANLRLGLLTAIATSDVPEPTTWATMTLGLGAIGFANRRKRKTGGSLALRMDASS